MENKINLLFGVTSQSPSFTRWQRDTRVALVAIFGEKSRHVSEFEHIRYASIRYSSTPSEEWCKKGLEQAKAILESMINELREYGSNLALQQNNENTTAINSNKIFIIHGHDKESKEMVARFLSQIDLIPVVLHEQANEGKTIIEKFETHADVGYAIALITPDDIGTAVIEPGNYKKRARQNVIFEFGYFIGKLGRNRVIGLVKDDVEMPSDYNGVVYTKINESG
jgi:predicted nucleotide-binding protein